MLWPSLRIREPRMSRTTACTHPRRRGVSATQQASYTPGRAPFRAGEAARDRIFAMTLRRGAVTLALCTALSAALNCAPPPRPVRPGLAPGAVKHYRPLEMASDARRADLAVVLGTDDANGSTVLPMPATATPVVVDALALSHASTPATGVAQAIVLTRAPAGALAPGGTTAWSNERAPGSAAGTPSPDTRTVPSTASGTGSATDAASTTAPAGSSSPSATSSPSAASSPS